MLQRRFTSTNAFMPVLLHNEMRDLSLSGSKDMHTRSASIKHIKFLERNGVKVKRICTDGGKEYNKARRYAEEEGVLWVSTQAYAPDMNG
jgi:hypothetical protein